MTKNEIEKLKEEIRQEILEEINDNKRTTIWRKFIKDEVRPILEKKYNNRQIYKIIDALNVIGRTNSHKENIYRIDEKDLEKVRPLILNIIQTLE